MKVSKRVRDGDVVSRRGDKYIRCSRRAQPAGVWREEDSMMILTLENKIKMVFIPRGVQVKGKSETRIEIGP